jgi:hypothetical protein
MAWVARLKQRIAVAGAGGTEVNRTSPPELRDKSVFIGQAAIAHGFLFSAR